MASTGMANPSFFIMVSPSISAVWRSFALCRTAGAERLLRFPAALSLPRVHRYPAAATRGITAARADSEAVFGAHFERPPTWPCRCFKGEHVLVAEFIENLSRRDARVRRSAREKQLTAGPLREFLKPGCRNSVPLRAVVFPLARVVDLRHDGHDVDRHVYPTGNRCHFVWREPAFRVDAIGQH